MRRIGVRLAFERVACLAMLVLTISSMDPRSGDVPAEKSAPRSNARRAPPTYFVSAVRNIQCRPHYSVHDGKEGQPKPRLQGSICPRQGHQRSALIAAQGTVISDGVRHALTPVPPGTAHKHACGRRTLLLRSV